MDVCLAPGKYVVAVSGGVDSVALLDLLVNLEGVKPIVAHFDHGIREDSKNDRMFVEGLAKKYKLSFVYDEGNLGAGVSEATARDARYKFLRRVHQISDTRAIVTAHHADDILETAVLNMLRGTGRKGLSSLRSTNEIIRPLIDVSKSDLITYANEHGLVWHEDSTNSDSKYLRNYVRNKIIPRFDSASKVRLRSIIDTAYEMNLEIDNALANQLHMQPSSGVIDKYWFITLPHLVSREVVVAWLRAKNITDLNEKLINRIVTLAKVLPNNKKIDVDADHIIVVESDKLALIKRDR